MGIHFIQESYRKLLNAMGRPGKIEKIDSKLREEGENLSFFYGTYTIMKILLDNEVTFKCISEKDDDKNLIEQLTRGRYLLEEADYIFISLKKNNKIKEVIENAKIGTLISPEKSATIVCEISDLNKGDLVKLKGPGVLDEKFIGLPLVEEWRKIRDFKNSEYPMGIDLIFVDSYGKIICIPRTTRVEEVL
ncbi:MAG: phosphonate C-P lyase system protein PhnH [Clostridium sp.]